MKSKKELFTLIAAILAGLGAVVFLILDPVALKVSMAGMSESEGLGGFDVLLGYKEGGVALTGFNVFALIAVVIGIAVCVLLVLTKLGKFNKELTVVYVAALAVAAVLVFLQGALLPTSEAMDLTLEMMEKAGADAGFGLAFGGILSGLCFAGSAALLAVNKWVIKE